MLGGPSSAGRVSVLSEGRGSRQDMLVSSRSTAAHATKMGQAEMCAISTDRVACISTIGRDEAIPDTELQQDEKKQIPYSVHGEVSQEPWHGNDRIRKN